MHGITAMEIASLYPKLNNQIQFPLLKWLDYYITFIISRSVNVCMHACAVCTNV